jgi:hypothetical protein
MEFPKIGLKIRSNNLDLIRKHDFFDFFEVYIDPDFDPRSLDRYTGYDITIHAGHFEHGFDPGDASKITLNEKAIVKALEAADAVRSPWVIVHPGHRLDPRSEQQMLDFLDDHRDRRLVFENCIAEDLTEGGLEYLFCLPHEMQNLLRRYNTKMCLDFGHAIVTANSLGLKPSELVSGFMVLEPACFHVSGIRMDSDRDTHLHLYEQGVASEFMPLVNKHVTLETPFQDLRDADLQRRDIQVFKDMHSRTKPI